jgi:hypothetical protein
VERNTRNSRTNDHGHSRGDQRNDRRARNGCMTGNSGARMTIDGSYVQPQLYV